MHYAGLHLFMGDPMAGFGRCSNHRSAVSSQTRQDTQLRQQLQETDPLAGAARNVEEETLTARPLPEDMGDVQIMTQKENKPWFFLTVDFKLEKVLFFSRGQSPIFLIKY